MKGGSVAIRPQTSSQFVSSLLLAGTLMSGGLELRVEGELPSRPYIDLTLDVLSAFGATVEHAPGSFAYRVPAGAVRSRAVDIEGDWSAAAFMAAAAAVAGGEVDVGPLHETSRQGDRVMCDILRSAGVEVTSGSGRVVFRGPARVPFEADLRDSPDLFPALVVIAACAPVGSRMTGLDNLRHKESDRFGVMVSNLERLGCSFATGPNTCEVIAGLGRAPTPPPEVTAADDHRIAMAMAVAALVAGPLVLDDATCVAKSFPDFWKVWQGLLATTSQGRHFP
jgi:3-phosphoshikimate 1-carboxyvinyltransferase